MKNRWAIVVCLWPSLIQKLMAVPNTHGCHRHEPKNKDRGRQRATFSSRGPFQPNQGSSGPPPFQRIKNTGLRLQIWYFAAD